MIYENSYIERLKDRKVCFVGPSPINKGKGLGGYIDSFDCVIRTNHAIELIKRPDYSRDYGKKCNVLYTNNQYYREMMRKRRWDERAYAAGGLEWLCMKKARACDLHEYKKAIHARLVRSTSDELSKIIPSYLMGALIIHEVCECKPREFYVTGIDFNTTRRKVFQENCYDEYVSGYLPEPIVRQGNIINSGKMNDPHDFMGNTSFIYRLWKQGKFTTDAEIERLMIGIMEGEIVQR